MKGTKIGFKKVCSTLLLCQAYKCDILKKKTQEETTQNSWKNAINQVENSMVLQKQVKMATILTKNGNFTRILI